MTFHNKYLIFANQIIIYPALYYSQKQTIPVPRGEGCMSGLRLETGQDKALKGAGEEYVCTC